MINEILPPTTKKAAFHTCYKINKEIRDTTISNINKYKYRDVSTVTRRIKKLDYEWDTERVLETNAAAIVFINSLIGYHAKRNITSLVTGTVGFFLLHHALSGWCPPLPFIRKNGVRSAEEINNEKIALKILRGDFLEKTNDPKELLNIAEK